MLLSPSRTVLEIDSAVLTVVYGLFLAAALVSAITAWFRLPAAARQSEKRGLQSRPSPRCCLSSGRSRPLGCLCDRADAQMGGAAG